MTAIVQNLDNHRTPARSKVYHRGSVFPSAKSEQATRRPMFSRLDALELVKKFKRHPV